MGTFAEYSGTFSIPEEKREQFTAHMLKLLNYGGMMQFETVSLYGCELYLLKPVRELSDGKVNFHYNYFEDDAWETACFNADKPRLWSQKIGGNEFCDVIVAAYTLCELYDTGPGLVTVNGEIVDTEPYVRWINHLLGTAFTHEKRFRLWEEAESYALANMEYSDAPFGYSDLMDLIPARLLRFAGGTEFADLCYLTKGTESLTEDQVEPGTYPADVLACKTALAAYLKDNGAPERLLELVQTDRERRAATIEPELQEIAQLSLFLPARVLVYLASELTGQPFWKNWNTLHKKVYHDEVMKEYTDEALRKRRREAIEMPAPGMETSDFLREDEWFRRPVPEELKDSPMYHVSDDDRLYWWGDKDVMISADLNQWLGELAIRHRELMQELPDRPDEAESDARLKDFLFLLADINEHYQRVFPFQNMVYDFIRNGDRNEYRAAVALLRELSEQNRQAGEVIRYAQGRWEGVSRKVTFNRGRLRMKRFLSVMANEQLREIYFRF